MSVREWLDTGAADNSYDDLAERLEDLADRFEQPRARSRRGPARMDDDLARALDAVSRLANLSDQQSGKPMQEWPERGVDHEPDSQKPLLDALNSVEKRLAAIEEAKPLAMPSSATVTGPAVDPAMLMMAEALRAIGQRFDTLENKVAPAPVHEARLGDLTSRIDGMRAAIAAANQAPPPAFENNVARAVNEITSRQRALDSGQANPGGAGAANRAFELFDSRLQDLTRSIAEARNPAPVMFDTSRIEQQLGALSQQLSPSTDGARVAPSSTPRVEEQLGQLAQRIDQQLQVLAQRLDMLGQAPVTPASMLSASHIDGLTSRIDALRAEISQKQTPDYGSNFSDLKQDITSLMMNMQGLSSQGALKDLSSEIKALRERVDISRQMGLSPGDADHLDDLAHDLQASLQNMRSSDGLIGVEASIRAISERLDYLNASARVDEGVINQLAGNLERLTERVESLAGHVAATVQKPADGSLSDVLQSLIDRLDQQRQSPDMSEALRSLSERLDQQNQPAGLPEDTVDRLAERVATETAGKLDNVNSMLDRLARRVDELGSVRSTENEKPDAARVRAPQRLVVQAPKVSASAEPLPSQGPLTTLREPADFAPPPVEAATPPRRTGNLVAERPLPPTEADLPIDPGEERPAWRGPRDGMRNQYLNAAREAAIAAAEETEARADSARSSRKSSDIFEQDEKSGLKARIGNLFKRKSKPVVAQDDDDIEPRIVEPRRMVSTQDINLNPENAGLQAQITNRRKPILVGIAVVLILLMGLQVLPGMVTNYIGKLKDASIIKKEQLIQPAAPDAPDSKAGEGLPQKQSMAPRVIPSTPSAETTASIVSSQAAGPDAVSATGRVIAPAGITISGGWANETGPVAKPTLDGKVPANLVAAAEKGIPEAAYELGSRYLDGRGVAVSMREAAQWYEKSAQAGFAPAQFRLGSLYEKGHGVARDLIRAKGLYEQAAAQGNAKAMHNLAVIHAEGVEGKPDYKGAVKWFMRGAEFGVVDSQYNLAILYARGLGVETNLAESYKWFALAADGGDKDAAKKREDVAARLDAQTLATAKLAAQTFFVKKEPEGASDATISGNQWANTPLTTSSTGKKAKPAASR